MFLTKFTAGHPAARWLGSCQGDGTSMLRDTKRYIGHN